VHGHTSGNSAYARALFETLQESANPRTPGPSILTSGVMEVILARCLLLSAIPSRQLAIGLGIRAARPGTGYRVLLATASQWVDRLADARASGRLQAELVRLSRYPLMKSASSRSNRRR
jgi:hypothetical protein